MQCRPSVAQSDRSSGKRYKNPALHRRRPTVRLLFILFAPNFGGSPSSYQHGCCYVCHSPRRCSQASSSEQAQKATNSRRSRVAYRRPSRPGTCCAPTLQAERRKLRKCSGTFDNCQARCNVLRVDASRSDFHGGGLLVLFEVKLPKFFGVLACHLNFARALSLMFLSKLQPNLANTPRPCTFRMSANAKHPLSSLLEQSLHVIPDAIKRINELEESNKELQAKNSARERKSKKRKFTEAKCDDASSVQRKFRLRPALILSR